MLPLCFVCIVLFPSTSRAQGTARGAFTWQRYFSHWRRPMWGLFLLHRILSSLIGAYKGYVFVFCFSFFFFLTLSVKHKHIHSHTSSLIGFNATCFSSLYPLNIVDHPSLQSPVLVFLSCHCPSLHFFTLQKQNSVVFVFFFYYAHSSHVFFFCAFVLSLVLVFLPLFSFFDSLSFSSSSFLSEE